MTMRPMKASDIPELQKMAEAMPGYPYPDLSGMVK